MAAAGVKDRLMDLLDAAREFGLRVLEDFKEQTRFFKMRTAIVGTYLLVALLSVVLIPPAGERNPLDARVRVDMLSFGARGKTVVEVTNEGRGWDDAAITIAGRCVRNGMPISGTWTLHERFLRGQTRALYPENFRDAQGFRPEIDVEVDSVTIEVNGTRWTKAVRGKAVK